MNEEFEQIWMHIVTKGGEFHVRDLGMHKGFSGYLYLNRVQENSGILQVEDDLWLSLDSVASIKFVREEVH